MVKIDETLSSIVNFPFNLTLVAFAVLVAFELVRVFRIKITLQLTAFIATGTIYHANPLYSHLPSGNFPHIRMKAEQYCFEDFNSDSSSDEESKIFPNARVRKTHFPTQKNSLAPNSSRISQNSKPTFILGDGLYPQKNGELRNARHLSLNLSPVVGEHYNNVKMKIQPGLKRPKSILRPVLNQERYKGSKIVCGDSDSVYSNTSNASSLQSMNGDAKTDLSLNRTLSSQSIPDVTLGVSSVFHTSDDFIHDSFHATQHSDDESSRSTASSVSQHRIFSSSMKKITFSPIEEKYYFPSDNTHTDLCDSRSSDSDSGSYESTIYEIISPVYSLHTSDGEYSEVSQCSFCQQEEEESRLSRNYVFSSGRTESPMMG